MGMISTLKKYLLGILTLVVLLYGILPPAYARSNAAGAPQKLYEEARQKYHALMGSKAKKALRDNWEACIARFLVVYEKYPRSPEAYRAIFTVAKLYHQLYGITRGNRDRDQALKYYQLVSEKFDGGRLTDDALFHQAELHLEKKEFVAARQALNRVIVDHQSGDQVPLARSLLRKIPKFPQNIQTKKAAPVAAPKAKGTILNKIDITAKPGFTRVVAHVSGPVEFSRNHLTNPNRFYLNLEKVRIGPDVSRDVPVQGGLLNRVRLSQYDSDTSRLVLDLDPERKTQVKATHSDSRVVIDIIPKHEKFVREGSKVNFTPVKPAKRMPAVVTAKASPVQKSAKKPSVPLVVIDAGHGGKDYGAVGKRGLLEKHVNLELSKRIGQILQSRYKLRVHLTRHQDTFIPLKERGDIANERNADLFVSIHANAARRKSAHGIETYYLGIANSEQAQETAARENGELVQSVKDDQVQQILASLISTTKINDSSRLAGAVQNNLVKSMKKKYRGVKDLGVKEGPFYVLHDADMPSILIEVGFVSNANEERRLKDSDYLNRLAASIAKGIYMYLMDKEPMI